MDNPYICSYIEINHDTIKYYFQKPGNKPVSYNDFINLLESKDPDFFDTFTRALNDATYKLSAYFWECTPVSKETINKPFEFVVTKSIPLNHIEQNFSSYREYISNNQKNLACSFLNLGRDVNLIIPIPQRAGNNGYHDYKNISNFTKNASKEQQSEFWKTVVKTLSNNLSNKNKWLSTNGLGVHYLHVRVDDTPKYYSFMEYRNPRKAGKNHGSYADPRIVNGPTEPEAGEEIPVKEEPSTGNDNEIGDTSRTGDEGSKTSGDGIPGDACGKEDDGITETDTRRGLDTE